MAGKEAASLESLLTDQFFYFFLRLRKSRVRKVVEAVNAAHPDESTEEKARRLIAAQVPLSFLGGALMHIPLLAPGVGQALKVLGFVGGTSVITRMHLYLILEIALLYGKDIDDSARVPEMLAVTAATGLAAGAPMLAGLLDFNPLYALPTAGATASAVSMAIGEASIHFYSRPALPADDASLQTEAPAT